MNNPPDISQDPKEYEEYAHGIQKHVRGYLMVGALLLTFTAITVALSYVDFGTRKANISIAMLVATLKAGAVAAGFMHVAFVDYVCHAASLGVPVLLRRERRKIDRAYGDRDLVSVRCSALRHRWDRRIQFSPVAARSHAHRTPPGAHRRRSE